MQAAVSPESIIALALLNSPQRSELKRIEGISALFALGRQKGLAVGRVALRTTPTGVYSEDVEAFIGRLLAAGEDYATTRSPIEIKQKGLEICREIIEEEMKEHPDVVREVADALNLKVDEITSLALG